MWEEGGGGSGRHRGGYRAGVRLFQMQGWRAVEGQGCFMVGLSPVSRSACQEDIFDVILTLFFFHVFQA